MKMDPQVTRPGKHPLLRSSLHPSTCDVSGVLQVQLGGFIRNDLKRSSSRMGRWISKSIARVPFLENNQVIGMEAKTQRKPGLKLIESDRIYRKREMRFEGNVICICVVMLLYFTHLESDGFKFRPTKVWKTMENQNKQRQPTISFRNKTCVKLFQINRVRNFTNTFQLIGTVHLHSCKRPSLVYIHLQNWFSCWCFRHTPFSPSPHSSCLRVILTKRLFRVRVVVAVVVVEGVLVVVLELDN